MQFEILILILPLFTGLVQTRRVIRAAPGKKTTGHYLVVVPPETSHERFEAIAEKIQNESLSSEMHKMEGPFVKIIVTKLSLDEANKIKDLDNVEFVEEETFAEASLSWALDRIDQVSPVLDGIFEPGGDGEGVDIYILDTGINYDHCEFDGNRAIYAGYDPVDNIYGTNLRGRDCHEHGTHVASLACGKNYGVAKKANCYSVRVLGCSGSAPYSVIIDGLNFAASNIINSCRPGIISMSLGGPYFSSLNFVSSNIVNRGIPVVAAAGNDDFTDACVLSPASAPGVITVGSSARGDDVSFFTNIGSCVNIFAPGSNVIGADHRCDECTCTKSLRGTSMATPLVSGTIALYLQEQPLLTPPQILEKLTEDCLKNVLNFNGLPFSLRDKTPNCLLHITGLGLGSGLFSGSRCGSGSWSGSGFDSGSGSGVEIKRKCPDNNKCEQLCALDVRSSLEVCYCYSGYVLDSNGLNCTDINECNIVTNPCEQHCINNDGSFICECNNGYTLDADGFTCTDIDECFEAFINEESICPGNQICQNMPGEFKCSCPEGSRLQRTMCVADDIGSSSILSSSMNTVITTSILSSTSLPTSTDKGFLEGTIAGIVVGSFVGILLIALLLFILVFILYKHFTKTEKYSFAKGSGVKADDYTIQNIYYEAYTSNQEDQSEMHPHLKEHFEEREESQI